MHQIIERPRRRVQKRRNPKHLTVRGDTWHLYWRVPKDFRDVEDRTFILMTTKKRVSEDPDGVVAAMVARDYKQEKIRYWMQKRQGATEALEAEHEDANRRCRMHGFAPTNIISLSTDPLETSRRLIAVKKELRNVEASDDPRMGPNVPAVTGGVEMVTVSISGMAALFKTLKDADRGEKDDQQIAKLHAPMKLVANELKHVVGDMDISALTDDHAVKFMEWWDKRVAAKEITKLSANVHFASLKAMWKLFIIKKKWKLNKHLWADLRYKKQGGGVGIEKPRVSFKREFIQDKLLAPGVLDGLDAEARDAFLVMIETGLRNKEFLSLRRKRVLHEGAILYVEIRPDGNELKTNNSFRVMPLVGVARLAMERRLAALDAAGKTDPDDLIFPSYWPDRDEWSREVNKYLTAKGLRGAKQSAYSLRHSLEDRMLNMKIEKDVRDILMGHRRDQNQEYGIGPELEWRHEYLNKIAFVPPEAP